GLGYAVSAMGAKKFGASKFGIVGAAVGAIAGLFIPIPLVGPLLGAFSGALVGEAWLNKRPREEAARAGMGAALGAVLGLMSEFGMGLVMATVIVSAFIVDWVL
ncbi:MAG: DUF456 domain-containing protein, partial [Myxococcota bacterium]|nr:DUF456 domain-containing protein [Myxococcota bacterium]